MQKYILFRSLLSFIADRHGISILIAQIYIRHTLAQCYSQGVVAIVNKNIYQHIYISGQNAIFAIPYNCLERNGFCTSID